MAETESFMRRDEDIIAFGPFQLDRTRYDLRREGEPVAIGARAMAVLLELTQNPGEILSSRELLRRVWQDTVVEEGTVRVHMALLRKILRNADPDGEYLQNVTGRGYRFVAPVVRQSEAVVVKGDDSPVQPQAVRRLQRKNNLPPRLTSIVGRQQVILTLVEKVPAQRFVTITGGGGSGKTTVAIAVAGLLAEGYADGVCLVDLASVMEARLVANALASSVGVAPLAADPLPEVLASLTTQSLLLILDNCEHVIDATARLAERVLQIAPGVHILATSREPLRAAGEAVHELAPLEVPAEQFPYSRDTLLSCPALQLFVERAEVYADAEIADDELHAVAEICRGLEGNPLAIEITAAHTRLIGVRSLVASLGNELLLSIGGRRTAERRHRSLRETFNWSHTLLSSAEQATFRRLSVFAGCFDVACAVAVVADSSVSEVHVFEALLSLARKSLVQVDLGSEAAAYRLLDLPKAYAREKLVEAGEEDIIRHRHSRMWCSVGAMQIHAHVRRGDDWVGAFGPRIEDLRAATRWSFSPSSGSPLGIKLTLMSLWFELVLAAESPRQPAWHDLYTYILRGSEDALLSGLTDVLESSRHRNETSVQGLTVLQQIGHGLSEQKSALWSLWFERVITRDYRIAINLSNAVSERGSGGGAHESALMDCMLALACGYSGDQISACRHAYWALDTIASGATIANPAGALLRCHIHTILARSLWLRGYAEQAVAAARRAVEDALLSGSHSVLCIALMVETSVAIWCGDRVLANDSLERLHEQSSKHSLEYYELWADCLRMILTTRSGSQAVEPLQLSMDPLNTSQYLDIVAALREDLVSTDAMVRAEAGRSGWCTSEIMRVKAERLIQSGGREALESAEALLRRALETARRQDARSWELRTAMSLARLWSHQQQVQEAEQLLTAVYSGFTEGFETADLKAARQLLDQLAPQRS